MRAFRTDEGPRLLLRGAVLVAALSALLALHMLRKVRAGDILRGVSAAWNYFLLRSTGPELQKALRVEAQDKQLPLAEVIRSALCEHYELECRPIKGVIRRDAWENVDTILLRLQPELFQAVKSDAAKTGESMRALILQALEARYLREEQVA